jgi:CDP-diacylglycerol--glycerol-3-phosphate 3-phosphatidyltransferase
VLSKGDTPASKANIANLITIARILAAPVFVWLLLADDGRFGVLRFVAAGIFILSIVTDVLDGYLARSRNLVTNVGIILDPIADKVLIGGGLVALSMLGELWWWVTVVILVREVAITLLRFGVIRHGIIAASRGGKAKTLAQALAIGLYLLPLPAVLEPVAATVMAVAVVLTVVTGLDYLQRAVHLRRTSPRALMIRERRIARLHGQAGDETQ